MKEGYTVKTKLYSQFKWILVYNYKGLNEVVNWHGPLDYKALISRDSIGLWKKKI